MAFQARRVLQQARGGDLHQLFRHVADALLHPRLARLPRSPAQAVELPRPAFGAVAGYDLDVFDRDEQFVVPGIDQHQAVVRGPADVDGLQSFVSSDPVFGMDDQIALVDVRNAGDQVFGPDLDPVAAHHALAQDVLFGDQGDPIGQLEAARQSQDNRRRLRLAGNGRSPIVGGLQGHATLAQDGHQADPRPFGIGVDHDPPSVGQQGLDIIRRFLEHVGVRSGPGIAEIAPRQAAQVDGVGPISGGVEGRKLAHVHASGDLMPFVGTQIQRFRRQRAIGHAAHRARRGIGHLGAGLIVVGDRRQPRFSRFGRLRIESHDHVFRQKIEQRFQSVVEQRQPMLHPRMGAARRNTLIQRIVVAAGAEGDTVAGAEFGDRRFVQGRFQGAADRKAVELFLGPLGRRIERPHLFQLVTEEIQAHRALGPGGIDIDDPAAHGVFPRLVDRFDPCVRRVAQAFQNLVLGNPVADLQAQARIAEISARRHPLQHRRNGGQHHRRRTLRARAMAQFGQRADAAGDDIGLRRDPVVGQAIPCRKGQHLEVRRHEGQRLGRQVHMDVVAGHEQNRLPRPRRIGQDQGFRSAGDAEYPAQAGRIPMLAHLKSAIVECQNHAQQRRVELRRRRAAPRHPFVDVVVRQFQKSLEIVQVGIGQSRDAGFGETAQDDVVFLHAAMLGAEQNAFSAGVHLGDPLFLRG